MEGILEIEREIERLPGEEFMELAAWMWQQAEDKGLLAACMEADADPDERVGRDEIFAILESPRRLPSTGISRKT